MYYKILGLIILVILIYIIFNLREGFDVSGTTSTLTPQSNEAVQNIAKIYADASGTVTFNNIRILGNVDVSGITTLNNKLNVTGETTVGNLKGQNIYGDLYGNLYGELSSPSRKYKISMQNNGDVSIYGVDEQRNVAAIGKTGIYGVNGGVMVNSVIASKYCDQTGTKCYALNTDGDIPGIYYGSPYNKFVTTKV